MIHEAYMPLYMGSRFSLRVSWCTGSPEVVQEALADLKMMIPIPHVSNGLNFISNENKTKETMRIMRFSSLLIIALIS